MSENEYAYFDRDLAEKLNAMQRASRINVYDNDQLAVILKNVVAEPVVKHLLAKVEEGQFTNLRKAVADSLEKAWVAEMAITMTRKEMDETVDNDT